MNRCKLTTKSRNSLRTKNQLVVDRIALQLLRLMAVGSTPIHLERRSIESMIEDRSRRTGYAILSTLVEVLLVGSLVWVAVSIVTAVSQTSNGRLTDESAKKSDPIFRLGKITADGLWVQFGMSRLAHINLATLNTRTIYESTEGPIMLFKVSQDGETYLVSREDRDIQVFRNNELLISEPVPEGLSVTASLAADGKTAAIVVGGTAVRIWNLADSNPSSSHYEISFKADRIALDPNGDKLVVVTNDGQLVSYDAKTGIRLPLLAKVEPLRINPEFSDDGKWLALSNGQGLSVFDMQTGAVTSRVMTGPWDIHSALAISSEGRLIALASYQAGIQILNRSSGETICTLSPDYAVNKMVFSSSEDLLYVCSPSFSSIRVWSLLTGKELEPIEPA